MAKEIRVPAYLHVNIGGAEREVAFAKVMEDAELRGQVVAKSLTEIEDWLDRWDMVLTYAAEARDDELAAEGMKIAAGMKAFRAKLGSRWPTWPNWIHDKQDEQDDNAEQ
jgi:hypothetical protein